MKKYTLFIVALLLGTSNLMGQYSANLVTDVRRLPTEPTRVVEQLASYAAGLDELYRFLEEEVEYPACLVKNGAEGTVVVAFTVGIDGELSNLGIVKSFHSACNVSIMSALEKMGAWQPAQKAGKSVASRIFVPIRFRLIP